jgi:PAS domain S-box/PAS domain S-box
LAERKSSEQLDSGKSLTDLQAELDALRAKNMELQAEIENQRRLKAIVDTPDHLSLILKHLSDAVIVSNHNGEVLLFNDSAEKMFGGWRPASPDQWSEVFQIYQADGKELYPNDQLPLIKALQGNEVRQDEMIVKNRKTSEEVYISISASPLKDSDGKTIGAVAVARDISDSIEAKRRLENSEKLFENFMNNNPALAFMKDADGRYVYVNDSFVRLFGRTRQEMEGIFDKDYLPPEAARQVRENDLVVLNSRQVAEFTESVPTPDGVDHEWLVFKFPFENINGSLHVGGIALDITERKKSMFNMLTEMVPSVLWITDAKGEVEYFNRGWYDLTGATEEQSLGANWLNFVDPRDSERVIDVWKVAVESGSVYEIEYRFIRGLDREPRWFLVRGLPLRRVDGTIDRWFGTCTDIHEQRRLKEELEQSMAELALARDEAQSASRLKSEFVANMSHEIRTPMNGVLGMVDILLKSELTPTTRQHALSIQRAGRDLLLIINEILDFSKIEAGKLTLELGPFNLKKVIEGAAEILLPIAQEKKLKFDSYTDPDIPAVLIGDPLRLRQVLLNLVGNALKFTHKGAVSLSATMLGASENCVKIRFEVKDTGIGISGDEVESLFEAFFQSDGSVSRKYGGTGLGLAICKTLVEMMEGTISVDSELGQGSTFSFELSFEVSADQNDEFFDSKG